MMKLTSLRPIILASGSPRRTEVLEMIGLQFIVAPSKVSEEMDDSWTDFNAYVKELALRKTVAVADEFPDHFVIGADTIVVHNGTVYPKPANPQQAKQFLREFSGQTHSVITGVCVYHDDETELFSVETKVTFRQLDDTLIDVYVDSGDPMDKAGAYGIQTAGALLVERIVGDFFNVMGLPIAQLADYLRRTGLIELKGGAPAIDD